MYESKVSVAFAFVAPAVAAVSAAVFAVVGGDAGGIEQAICRHLAAIRPANHHAGDGCVGQHARH